MYHNECQEINWNASGIQSYDPCTIESECEVQKIINLQNIANNLLEALLTTKLSQNHTILLLMYHKE
jgi:hypothetical protein